MNGIFFNPPIDKNYLGHQMSEIFRDRIYDPFLLGKKDLVILDVGANVGVTSYFFSQFAKQVYSLEPSKEQFEVLSEMVRYNGLTNVKPIQKAIYTKDEQLPFGGPDNNKTMNSLHMATWEEGKHREMVDCITLETLFKNEGIDTVDLMKLDVEGSEYEIVAHTSFLKMAPRIKNVIVEVHDWARRNPEQMVDSFENAGYKVSKVPSSANLLAATYEKSGS